MGKTKIIFSVLTIVITLFLVRTAIKFNEKTIPEKFTVPVIQVTGISKGSNLFQDLSLETPLTVSDTLSTKDLRVKTDSQTAFELFYKECFLNILPDSYIYYNSRRKSLSLISGELYWEKAGNSPVKINIGEDETFLSISSSGRVRKSSDGSLAVWSYKGGSKLSIPEEDLIDIPSGQYFVVDSRKAGTFLPIPKATTYISPEKKDVHIKKIMDFLVKIDWKFVQGATEYKVKLYPSPLRENILLEKIVASNRTGIDLEEFEQTREFYWEILPLSKDRIEGEPSTMGEIDLFGVLIREEKDRRSPELAITSMTVNGNMVLIRGDADINSELYIDEVPVKIDSNGIFIYTKRYKTLGLKQIVFKIISPSGVELVQTKQVRIYEE